MTRIILRREEALPNEEVLEFRVFEREPGDVRAVIVPVDFVGDHAMIEDMSEPVAEAFADALELCNRQQVSALWIHDPKGAFPVTLRSVPPP